MKKIFSIFLMSFLIISCSSYKTDDISFEEYTNIVKNMEENDKCIVFFSQEGCSYCKSLKSSINTYIKKDNKDNIPIYRVDVTVKNNNYIDLSIGTYKDKENDKLYKLDKRIANYKVECNISYTDLYDNYSEDSYFDYIFTPMFIFYESGKEVYIKTNFDDIILQNGKTDYEAFKEFMTFKETYKYSKEFML